MFYLLLLTGDREYGDTVFPSSSGRALLVLTEYYNTEIGDYSYRKKLLSILGVVGVLTICTLKRLLLAGVDGCRRRSSD